jgi:hypothetical protein
VSTEPDRVYSAAEALDAEREHLQRAGAREADGYAALCLSGGGIRSAAFALGVIQGLAKRNVLSGFDYLSTVSGGGFAGGWLSAWLYHGTRRGDRDHVFRQLSGTNLEPGRTEAAPVAHMRAYSRYMTPELGGLSADSWTLVATMLRNVFLNWMVLLPLIAAGLLAPRVYLEMVQAFDRPLLTDIAPVISVFEPASLAQAARMSPAATWLFVVSTLLQLSGAAFMVTDLPSYGNRRRTQSDFLLYCLTPIVLGTIGLTLFWPLNVVPLPLAFIVGVSVVAGVGTWVVFGLIAGARKWRPRTWAAAAATAPIAAVGLWWLTNEPFSSGVALGPLYCTLAFPLALGSIAIANMVFVALSSNDHTEGDLEWHARYNAWIFITIIAWLSITALVFLAPLAFRSLRDFLSEQMAIESAHATGVIGGAGSLLASVLAYFLRRPDSTNATTSSAWKSVAMTLAAPVFLVLLLGAIAWANVAAVTHLYKSGKLETLHQADMGWLRLTPAGRFAGDVTAAEVVVVTVVLFLVGWVMARFVPVNTFSLHGMYRERLIRAFLGASRASGERHPNPFTGFDPSDNLPMHVLRQVGRPFHVVNTTLNRVAEKGLAMQFRKAESFTITPLHSGSSTINAYRPSDSYADDHIGGTTSGVSLGKAMAISGAAASPNMGAKSTPTLTFLMTLLNARLGVWIGNPGPSGHDTWTRGEPQLGVGPLLSELFGRTTDRNPYIYLSDGGHFENLGLLEMVRRRCRWILVSDAGCDATYTFSDLATAVRLIRLDLGIPIVFDDGMSIDASRRGEHFAVGRIQYSALDLLAEDGILIYVKATLCNNETIDVQNYAKDCPAFPHESTADQWFTEAQFESYRMLGQSSVMQVADAYPGDAGVPGYFKWAAKQSRARASQNVPHTQPVG